MWLARFFGRSARADDEPARFAPPSSAGKHPPGKQVNSVGTNAATPSKSKDGFDPYNSGAFERQNAWERVIRR